MMKKMEKTMRILSLNKRIKILQKTIRSLRKENPKSKLKAPLMNPILKKMIIILMGSSTKMPSCTSARPNRNRKKNSARKRPPNPKKKPIPVPNKKAGEPPIKKSWRIKTYKCCVPKKTKKSSKANKSMPSKTKLRASRINWVMFDPVNKPKDSKREN